MERIADILKTLERYKRYENDGISLQPHEGRYVKDIEYLLAENERLKEYAQKIKGASYRGSNYVLGCIEKIERVDEDKVMSEFDHIHTLSVEALKQE